MSSGFLGRKSRKNNRKEGKLRYLSLAVWIALPGIACLVLLAFEQHVRRASGRVEVLPGGEGRSCTIPRSLSLAYYRGCGLRSPELFLFLFLFSL